MSKRTWVIIGIIVIIVIVVIGIAIADMTRDVNYYSLF
jgi:hypothetical protein